MWNLQRTEARQSLDERIALLPKASRLHPPHTGWLRAIRNALGLTTAQVGDRLGVVRQRVSELERAEQHGAITIKSMRRAAEALDCTFVYAVLPNRPLEQMVDERARAIALEELAYLDQTMGLENQAVDGGFSEERINDYIAEHISERDIWSRK